MSKTSRSLILSALVNAFGLGLCACATTERGGGLPTGTAASAPAREEPDPGVPRRSVVLGIGGRGVNAKDDDQVGASFELQYASRGEGALGWEAAVSWSDHEAFLFGDESVQVIELGAGGRATWLGWAGAHGGVLPYASAGLALLELSGGGTDEGAVGAYARLGLDAVFAGGFTLGTELKGLVSSSDDLEYYLQLALHLGWSF